MIPLPFFPSYIAKRLVRPFPSWHFSICGLSGKNIGLKLFLIKKSCVLENKLVLEYEDKNNLLDSGAIGLIVEDGTLVTDEIVVG